MPDPALTVLRVRSWQSVVCHAIPAARINIRHMLAGEDVPRVTITPTTCSTALPALLCSCGRYFIEACDDDGPQAVGWEGRWE
jgi:hypothetical protein